MFALINHEDARPAPPTSIGASLATTAAAESDSDPAPLHNLGLNLTKYRILESQHDALLENLDSLRPSSQGSDISTSAADGPLSSPSRRSSSTSCYYRRHHHQTSSSSSRSSSSASAAAAAGMDGTPRRRSSVPPLAPVPDEQQLSAAEAEAAFSPQERLLLDVNEGIKRSLTELLNCEQARADAALRMRIQSRLLEAERELRTGRRRRSYASGA